MTHDLQSGTAWMRTQAEARRSWSGPNRGGAAETNAIGKTTTEVDIMEVQQLKQMQSGTIREQQLRRTQLGSSSWSRHKQGAATNV